MRYSDIMLASCSRNKTEFLGDNAMKVTLLVPAAYAALLFGSASAYAQTTSTTPADPPTMAQNSTTSDSTGNDLLNGAKSPAATKLGTPTSTGENKANGNDLVSGDNRSDRDTGTHPAFKTMDTNKSGYLTAADIKSHHWLSKNFSRCDTDHDGQLSQKEYASCTK
jgi:hypothetical protein